MLNKTHEVIKTTLREGCNSQPQQETEMADLTIIIVNWNTRELLANCLHSIFAHDQGVTLEVIVVDNASHDKSADTVRGEFPQVHLIANNENVGFARANNQALLLAKSRHVLLLNSDTVVLPGALPKLVTYLDEHLQVGVVGPRLLNPDGTFQRSCWRGFPSLSSAFVDAFYLWRLVPRSQLVQSSELLDALGDEPVEVDHVLGACMMVRNEVIQQVGGMDEDFFLFSEETEWCYRIKEAGWKICFLPAAKIIHFGQQSVHQNPQRTLPEKYRNYVRFYRKHENPSRLQEAILKGIIVVAGLLRVGLWTWRSRAANQRDRARRMRYGYWEVIRQSPSF
jgi:GT2 family glycosyltransferase